MGVVSDTTDHPRRGSSPLALTVLALLHYQPLHPYGIQRLIKQWGKDQVVNVEQRTSLYRTIEQDQPSQVHAAVVRAPRRRSARC